MTEETRLVFRANRAQERERLLRLESAARRVLNSAGWTAGTTRWDVSDSAMTELHEVMKEIDCLRIPEEE